MECWKSGIDLAEPCWADYRELINELDAGAFPAPEQLNRLLPPDLASGGGRRIRFVPAEAIPGVEYERHIFETGQVSTREGSWHDLFNALAWARFPTIKSALNAAHYRHGASSSSRSRGPVRDALTLLDESGAIVFCSDERKLCALAAHDWSTVFRTGFRDQSRTSRSGEYQPESLDLAICGHAQLEKFLNPYKAMTVKVLLVCIDGALPGWTRDLVLRWLDTTLAARIDEETVCTRTSDLSPLPLTGIPGWSGRLVQNEAFYADTSVFRPLRPAAGAASIVHLDPGQE